MSSPATANDPVGSGSAALLLAFLTAIMLGDGRHRCSSLPESRPTQGWLRDGQEGLPARSTSSLDISAVRGQGHFPVKLSPGRCAASAGTRRPSLLLIFSRGKADLIQTWQMGSRTWSPPRWPLPPRLLVVLWTPRAEGGL